MKGHHNMMDYFFSNQKYHNNQMKMNNKTSLTILCAFLTIPSLSSCVDGDYYDLYDDENECSVLRKKRSKDSEGYAAYPDQFLASEQFFYAECGACCYKNLTGSSNVNARKALISQMHGGVITDEYIRTYYFDIMYIPAEVQENHVLHALQELDNAWGRENVSAVLNYIRNQALNGDYNILDNKYLAAKGLGHIAQINNITSERNNNVIIYNFFMLDQYSDYNYYPNPRSMIDHFTIYQDYRTGTVLSSDIDDFIWKDR